MRKLCANYAQTMRKLCATMRNYAQLCVNCAWQKGCPDGESALLMRKLYATMSKLFVTVRGHVAGMLAPREVIVNSS